MPGPARKYDRVAFVKAWLQSTSIDGVCEAMSMKPDEVRRLAHNLRVQGVELPRMYHRGKRGAEEIAALNKLIAEAKP
jgi:hypothetical protein